MTKFYDDNNKLLEITMTDDCTGASWEYDFFDVGALPFNAELGAYKVKDVEYLADYAQDLRRRHKYRHRLQHRRRRQHPAPGNKRFLHHYRPVNRKKGPDDEETIQNAAYYSGCGSH